MNLQIIKDLLINLLLVILPFYLYLLLKKNNSNFFRDKGLVIFCSVVGSIMMILCMAFPIKTLESHIFDLRQVPLIIGFLYVGRTCGVVLFVIFIITRAFLGGDGIYGSIIVNSLLMIMLFFIYPTYNTLSVKVKFIVASGLTLFCCGIIYVYFLLFLEGSITVLVITPQLFVAQTIALFIIIFTIEKLKRDAFIARSMQKAEKAQIVSDMAAAVSHEIRNPLTVTKGFLQLVISQPFSERTKDQLKLAQEELTHAEHIINNYLSFAKPTLEYETVLNLPDEIRKVVSFITPYANMQSVQINFYHDEDDYQLVWDAQKLHQCMSNIIKNGVEAMPGGGTVDIVLERVGNKIELKISDTGVGMSSEQLKRLGEPYFTTKQSGTGLGMMVVYSIFKSLNGKITVTSVKGKGTTFTLKF